jgi:homoserine kinase
LISGLADRRQLRREATEDRLHEAPRSVAFPESHQLLAGLVEAGAMASCWSGSGPSLLGICDVEDGQRVRDAGEELLAKTGVGGRSLLLRCDTHGLVVGAAA